MKRTKSGKLYETVTTGQTGNRVTDKVIWEIKSAERLEQEEVEEIIEQNYPHAGYGPSGFRRFNRENGEVHRIEVWSYASCD